MDGKQVRDLMEAYIEVYAPQQIDEISQKTATRAYAASATGEFEGADSDRDLKRTDNLKKHIVRKFGAKAGEHADRAADSMTFGRKDASGKSKGLPKPRIEKSDYRTTQDGKMHKQDQRELKTDLRIKRDRRLRVEELDIFDIVLEFLQTEGIAKTLEEAQEIMANELDADDIEAILEAEGSYGQTPKAREAMGKLAISRREKPASEYSQKGEKTKKVKEIEKHTRRIDNGPDVGNRGKKSTKPRWSGYLGAKGRGKMDQDSRDWSRDSAVEYTAGGHKPGPGTVTKNPKKLRKQKAIGEID